MDMIGLFGIVQKGELPSLCWIHGEEEYSVDSTIQAAKKLVEFEDLNITEYKSSFDVDEFVAKLGIPPMMAQFRLILIRKTRLFYWCKDDAFYRALSNLPDFIRIIIHETEFLKTQDSYKKLKKIAVEVKADRFTRPQMTDWVKKQLKLRKIPAGAEVIRAILERSGYFIDSSETTMYDLVHAFDYFASLKREIEVADAERYFGNQSQQSVFELYDALGTPAFFPFVMKMLQEGEAALKLLAMIGNFVRNIYKLKLMEGRGEVDLIDTEMTPFIRKKASQKAKRYPLEELQALMQACTQADIDMKSTLASEDALLQSLALKLSGISEVKASRI